MAPGREYESEGVAMTSLVAEEFDRLFTVTLPPRPYPGLRPFEKDEWPIFFGRERMADAVVAQLLEKRVLMVHGDSGCGKSSLVRAAVLPKLEQESARGGIVWRTCSALPREAPLWNIAGALANLNGDDPGEERVLAIRRALNFCGDAPQALADLARRGPNDHVCILIDQFEELFEHARRHGPEEAQLLTAALIGFFADPPEGLYVILTMRSEFLGACARYKGFAEMVNGAQYLLPRMGHDDLLRAIREPATLYDGEVSRELAERLIADAGGTQDELPLIQHGLMLLHRDRVAAMAAASAGTPGNGEGHGAPPLWRLTLEHYRHEGRLAGLLSDHADTVMLEAEKALGATGTESRLVEDLFRALTDINAEGHAIRRPRTLAQLAAISGADESAVRLVIDRFRADGVSFLKPYGSDPIEGSELIDISHEALLRCWRRLAEPGDGWLIREFRNGLVWRSLLVQADSFEREHANVLSPMTTDERERWLRRRNARWAERYGGGWERVVKLIAASISERDARKKEDAAARQREQDAKLRVQRWKLLGAASTILFLIMILAYLKVSKETEAAKVQFQQAEAARQQNIANNDAVLKAQQTLAVLDKSVAELGRADPSAKGYAGLSRTIDKAKAELSAQVGYTASAAKPTANASAVSAPRVYIHIADNAQRLRAGTVERALEERDIGGGKIVVPGIQLVTAYPTRSVLRCFKSDECADEGKRLAETVNGLLRTPKVTLEDLSERYSQSKTIRAHHYELWFAPGEIALQGSGP